MEGLQIRWTDERTATMVRLWNEGLSASEIAARLGGLTRNAVIGKVHRLGLQARGAETMAQARSRAARNTNAAKRPRAEGVVKAPKISSEPLPEELPPLGATIAAEDRHERHCQWIYGEVGKGHTYCGCKKVAGTSWCIDHLKVVFPNYGATKQRDRLERVAKLETV